MVDVVFINFVFFYQFIVRVTPGLIISDVMKKFQIDASSYGLFASAYYFGYAGMQIPIALLLDKYGPRKIISLCALTCSVATIIFVYTNNWGVALVSRFLIGLGSAAGFLGVSRIISQWFSFKEFTKMVGLTFSFGLIGALYGGKPIGLSISIFGWENVLLCIGFVGVIISLFIAVIIRSPCLAKEKIEEENSMVSNLMFVLINPKLIFIALANLLMVGALEGFADVWGVSYVSILKNINNNDGAFIISMIFLGMLFGGPLLAHLSEKFKTYYGTVSICGFLIGIIFLFILFLGSKINSSILCLLFFIIGILCCYQVIVFSIGVSLVSKEACGVTIAFLNSINMLGGSFFHTTIGLLIDYFWLGQSENNIRLYDIHAYTYGLFIIPLTAIIGGIIFLCLGFYGLKEKGLDESLNLKMSLEN